MACLRSYPFPGNVRELLAIVVHSVATSGGLVVLPEHLPEECTSTASRLNALVVGNEIVPLREIESRYLNWALQKLGRNRRELTETLGISSKTLRRKLQS